MRKKTDDSRTLNYNSADLFTDRKEAGLLDHGLGRYFFFFFLVLGKGIGDLTSAVALIHNQP